MKWILTVAIVSLVGCAGPQGPTGNDGRNGSNGSQGPQGSTGAQGSTGTNGSNGSNGAAGTAGMTITGQKSCLGPGGNNNVQYTYVVTSFSDGSEEIICTEYTGATQMQNVEIEKSSDVSNSGYQGSCSIGNPVNAGMETGFTNINGVVKVTPQGSVTQLTLTCN